MKERLDQLAASGASARSRARGGNAAAAGRRAASSRTRSAPVAAATDSACRSSRSTSLGIPTQDMSARRASTATCSGLPQNEHRRGGRGRRRHAPSGSPSAAGRRVRRRRRPASRCASPTSRGARAELEAKGVEFDRRHDDTGVCHMGFFKDPDGNSLILHRRYAPDEAEPSCSSATARCRCRRRRTSRGASPTCAASTLTLRTARRRAPVHGPADDARHRGVRHRPRSPRPGSRSSARRRA